MKLEIKEAAVWSVSGLGLRDGEMLRSLTTHAR